MMITTSCKKCGSSIRLDFGGLSKEEAIAAAERMDRESRECPGRHVELSGWRAIWSLDGAIHRAYDLGEGEAETPVPTDREHVERLQALGAEVIDGGCNTVPELGLRGIHAFKDLEHIGFGEFASPTHAFERCDSPRGTRFYRLVPRNA